MMKRDVLLKSFLLVAVAMVIFISGCSYYRVTDPSTEIEYYTTDVKKLSGGAVRLEDSKTDKTITLQNSEVEKISKDEYKQGLYVE